MTQLQIIQGWRHSDLSASIQGTLITFFLRQLFSENGNWRKICRQGSEHGLSTQSWLLGFTLICLFFMDDGYLGHSLEEEEDGRPAWARGQAQQFHCSAFSFRRFFKRLERFGLVTKIPIFNFCQAFVAWFDQKFSPRQFVGGVVHIVQGSVFSLWWLFPHQGMSLHVFDKV